MANEKEPLPTVRPQEPTSKQSTLQREVPTSGRTSTRSSKTLSDRFGALANVFMQKSAPGVTYADKFRRAETEKSRSRQQTITDKNNDKLQLSVLYQEEQNDLLRRIIDRVKGLPPTRREQENNGGGVSLLPEAGRGQRGRFGNRARERLQRMQRARQIREARLASRQQRVRAVRRARAVQRLGRQAGNIARSSIRTTSAVARRVRETITPTSRQATTRIEPSVTRAQPSTVTPRATAPTPIETDRIRPRSAPAPETDRISPRPLEQEPERTAPRPQQQQPETERMGERDVGGRRVRFNQGAYNRTIQGIRIAGGVGLVIGAMGIAQQVNELYTLRQLNKENADEGITEEEFQKELTNLAGSVIGGAAGAYLGAKVGGLLGGVTGGPWGALAGGIAGGLFGGLTGESAGELIGAALFDQLTGSNTFDELWNRKQDEARRNLTAGASTLGAAPETDAERVVQQQQAQEEDTQRRLAGIETPFENPELEREIRALQTARRNLAANPTNRRLREVVNRRAMGLQNLLNSPRFRVSEEDRQRALQFLRTEPVEPARSDLASPASFTTAPGYGNHIQSLLNMLSGNEFNEIRMEADKIEFDGNLKLSATEAEVVTRTSSINRGYSEIEPVPTPTPTAGGTQQRDYTAPPTGGRSIAAAPAPSAVYPQVPMTSGTSTTPPVASPVSAAPVSPSISGSAESSGEGSISQIIQTGPGFNLVQYSDGRIERRTGSRNWRNNNPGNLEFGNFSRRYGAIGTDGRFAIFPTYEAGQRAKEALLFEGRGYAGLTVAQAITRYAPPNENDTAMYIRTAAAAAGVSPNTPMRDLNQEQRRAFLAAMERIEGFRVGRVNVVQQATAIAAAPQPSVVSQGIGLASESAGMTAADQAQAMGMGQQVVVQLPPSQESDPQRINSTQTAASTRAGEVSLNRRLEKQVA